MVLGIILCVWIYLNLHNKSVSEGVSNEVL